ncbi:MAG: tetratricopeptide repeat protein [Bacteroidales bacterium]|nr:tetratricopeptide repeat protein [Bacteroidales bacterium]
MCCKNYAAAKDFYNQATAIKPSEQYPSTKIIEIDRTVQANKVAADKAKAAELDKQYQAYLTQGDTYYKNKDYKNAAEAYNNALMLKPSESYPKLRVNEINKANAAAEAKKQQEIEAGYQNALIAAEKAVAAKDFTAAKAFYQQAQQINPQNPSVQSKIAEMDRQIAADNQQKQQQQVIQNNYNEAVKKSGSIVLV